jgi:hypothetical protein
LKYLPERTVASCRSHGFVAVLQNTNKVINNAGNLSLAVTHGDIHEKHGSHSDVETTDSTHSTAGK